MDIECRQCLSFVPHKYLWQVQTTRKPWHGARHRANNCRSCRTTPDKCVQYRPVLAVNICEENCQLSLEDQRCNRSWCCAGDQLTCYGLYLNTVLVCYLSSQPPHTSSNQATQPKPNHTFTFCATPDQNRAGRSISRLTNQITNQPTYFWA